MSYETAAIIIVHYFCHALFFLFRSGINTKKELGLMQDKLEELQHRYGNLNTYLILQETISGHNLNVNALLNNRDGNAIKLAEILSDSVTQIMYIPRASCSSCNEQIFGNLPHAIELTKGKLKVIAPVIDFNSIVIYSNHKLNNDTLFATDESIISRKIFDPLSPCIIK